MTKEQALRLNEEPKFYLDSQSATPSGRTIADRYEMIDKSVLAHNNQPNYSMPAQEYEKTIKLN